MIEASRIQSLLDARKPHHSLPQPFYCDADLFDVDMEAIFHRSWLLVGFEAELAEPAIHPAPFSNVARKARTPQRHAPSSRTRPWRI